MSGPLHRETLFLSVWLQVFHALQSVILGKIFNSQKSMKIKTIKIYCHKIYEDMILSIKTMS